MAEKNTYPYDDFVEDSFEAGAPAPARDERVKLILDELSALKASIAKIDG